MKILTIDTSSKNLNIALNIDGETGGLFIKDCNLTHSEVLMRNIDSVLKSSNLKLSDFDYFGCCIGPGSFTGIRIGVTTIRAFAQVFKKPCIAVNSLELFAYNLKSSIVISCVNAMQNKIYYCVFKDRTQITEPSYLEIKDFNELYSKYNGVIVSDIEIPGFKTVSPKNLNKNLSELSKKAAAEKRVVDYNNLVPLYVRNSSAEKINPLNDMRVLAYDKILE